MKFVAGRYSIGVNVPDFGSLLETVAQKLGQGNGFSLATINLDHLVKIRSNPDFASAYAAQDLVVADGNPIVWLLALAGQRVELVPGSDSVIPLAQVAARVGVPVVLVGSTPDNLAGAARALTEEVPGLTIAQQIAPAMGFDATGPEARDILARIAQLGPVLVFVALGAPKQEIFSALGRELAPSAGFANVGAGLDFLSGGQVRAPQWVRDMAFEWLWRAFSAPRRLLPRYLACLAILPNLTMNALRQRRGRGMG